MCKGGYTTHQLSCSTPLLKLGPLPYHPESVLVRCSFISVACTAGGLVEFIPPQAQPRNRVRDPHTNESRNAAARAAWRGGERDYLSLDGGSSAHSEVQKKTRLLETAHCGQARAHGAPAARAVYSARFVCVVRHVSSSHMCAVCVCVAAPACGSPTAHSRTSRLRAFALAEARAGQPSKSISRRWRRSGCSCLRKRSMPGKRSTSCWALTCMAKSAASS